MERVVAHERVDVRGQGGPIEPDRRRVHAHVGEAAYELCQEHGRREALNSGGRLPRSQGRLDCDAFYRGSDDEAPSIARHGYEVRLPAQAFQTLKNSGRHVERPDRGPVAVGTQAVHNRPIVAIETISSPYGEPDAR